MNPLIFVAIGVSVIIFTIILIANLQKNKYRRTGFYFAVILSFTYQPILLSITIFGTYGMLIGLSGAVFFTTMNFLYILYIENKIYTYLAPILLPISNILMHILIIHLIKYMNITIEGNGYAFGIIFAFLPWLIFLLITGIFYAKSIQIPNKTQINYGSENIVI